ncbi:MAG TPA: CrcB family protein [Vicinamibacterales bacterium]|nr:CrcB family protein [Vicinamibacterales bacterium]
MTWVMVAVGGAAGSLARYAVGIAITRAAGGPAPLATAVVNVAGCALAGLLLGAMASGRLPLTIEHRALIFAGILGGFTTFSGVGIDTLALVQQGRGASAAVNIALQIAAGLAALAVAFAMARR